MFDRLDETRLPLFRQYMEAYRMSTRCRYEYFASQFFVGAVIHCLQYLAQEERIRSLEFDDAISYGRLEHCGFICRAWPKLMSLLFDEFKAAGPRLFVEAIKLGYTWDPVLEDICRLHQNSKPHPLEFMDPHTVLPPFVLSEVSQCFDIVHNLYCGVNREADNNQQLLCSACQKDCSGIVWPFSIESHEGVPYGFDSLEEYYEYRLLRNAQTELYRLERTFQLLRAKPDVLQLFIGQSVH